MSPGNGYFKQEVIDKIISYVDLNYDEIKIFIPDIPAISTYMALGYTEEVARKSKAIPQGNALRNKVLRSLDSQKTTKSIEFFNWKDSIENNIEYKKELSYLNSLYINNNNFHNDIFNETEMVLSKNNFKKKDIERQDVEIGVHYILSEFAFLIYVSNLYKKQFDYGYHRSWFVFEKFIDGYYDQIPKTNLRFVKLPDFSKEQPNYK